MLIRTLSLILLLSCTGLTAQAEIYHWTNAAGETVYSDQKRDKSAKTTSQSDSVNYFTPTHKPVEDSESDTQDTPTANTVSSASTDEKVDTESTTEPLTEKECQKIYRRSCDEALNWKKYAIEQCGADKRCDDDDFLERKYRPRTAAEIRKIANRAAIRNNRDEEKIDMFLRKKYSNYCDNQAAMYCQSSNSNCKKTVLLQCQDSRSLEDIFQQYQHLSVAERRAIIEQAKAMTLARGENQLNYSQILLGLADILLSQALMGI